MTLTVSVTNIQINFIIPIDVPVDIQLIESEFYFKEGIGMVLQDQNISTTEAHIQALEWGRVSGRMIMPDGTLQQVSTGAKHWNLYDN